MGRKMKIEEKDGFITILSDKIALSYNTEDGGYKHIYGIVESGDEVIQKEVNLFKEIIQLILMQ